MSEILDQNPPKRGSKPTIILISIIVLGLIAFTGYTLYERIQMWKGMAPPPPGPANVIAAKVEPYQFSDRIEAIGTAEADESITISATETEIIEKILFEDGQVVKKGDLLVQLKDDEETATYEEARKAYNRYAELAKKNAGSRARRDEALAMRNVAYARVQDRKIVAPFDGITGIRMVSEGDLVRPGTEITTLDDINPIEVEFSVPETYLKDIAKDLPVEAYSDAYPQKIFTGTISSLNSRVDSQTRAIVAKASIDNEEGLLTPGQLMKVEILQNTHTSPAIPEDAVQFQGSRKTVMKITEGEEGQKIAVPTPVELGLRRAGYVEVLSGIEAGNLVIVEGSKARPNGPVTIVETRSIAGQIDVAIDFALPRKKQAMENLQDSGQLPEPEQESSVQSGAE